MFALTKKTLFPVPASLAVEKRSLRVGEQEMPLTIRRNNRAARITLRIEPGGRALHLTVPPGLRKAEIEEFLDRHQGWLAVRLEKFASDNPLHPGGRIALRGIDHRIEHSGTLRGLTAALVVDGEPVLKVSGLEEHIGRRIAAFLKKEARADLERLVTVHAAAIRKPVKSLTLKDTRSRWGSCSSSGSLSFSWRIVMAPPLVIDYLAAHEVAHLAEMNHGPRFWALCGRLCPQMDEARLWLRRHGSQLHAIDFD